MADTIDSTTFPGYSLSYHEHDLVNSMIQMEDSDPDMSILKLFGYDDTQPLYKDRWEIVFPNGYGASVIRTPFSYGGNEGLFELAVIHDGQLAYNTPITPDVKGWLSVEDVIDLLRQIEMLPLTPRPPKRNIFEE